MRLKIEHLLMYKPIPCDVLDTRGIELLSEIEGQLTIHVDCQVFFDSSDINLLELAVQLHRWLSADVLVSEFVYHSFEHDEPILIFSNVCAGKWVLDSIWKAMQPVEVEQVDLMSAVNQFLVQLDIDLERLYGLKSLPDYNYRL